LENLQPQKKQRRQRVQIQTKGQLGLGFIAMCRMSNRWDAMFSGLRKLATEEQTSN
jgi:hypothetical protein